MDPVVRGDQEDLPLVALSAADLALGFLASLESRPVIPSTTPPAPASLPASGTGGRQALADFATAWMPTMVASAGPRFQAYVTGGSTPAAMAGDWLASALDQNVASSEGGAAALEREVVAWLTELLELDSHQSGVLVSGATMANFVGLATAREWAGRVLGTEINGRGAAGIDLPVLSAAPHSCIGKSLSMLGLGRESLRRVPAEPGREAVDLGALARMLAEIDGPAVVSASAGTVNTGDFDDLVSLSKLRGRHRFWLHVDAAFGAFAVLDERTRELARGLALADSVAVDLHKWLNVPYDAGLALTRHPRLRRAVFHNDGAYLSAADGSEDPLHVAPENSRRFRALPAWMTMRAYGREGHAEIVRRNIDASRRFAGLLGAIAGVEVLAPVRLNIVCFDPGVGVQDFVRALAASGQGYLTPTTYAGRPAVRAAFSSWSTEVQHVDALSRAVASSISSVRLGRSP